MSISSKKGYSLIETLVVLFIMMLIAAITVPNYFQFASHKKLDTAARDIQTAMRTARSFAITQRAEYHFVLIKDNDGVYTGGYEITDLPGNVIEKIYHVPDTIVVDTATTAAAYAFSATGGVSPGGTITLKNSSSSEKKDITILFSTGRIQIGATYK